MVFIFHLLLKLKNLIFIQNQKNFMILGSAHNKAEINKKKDKGCEISIFLAPLRLKSDKKKIILMLVDLTILTLNNKTKFIAFGWNNPN